MTDQNQPLRDMLAMITAARTPNDNTLQQAALEHLQHETPHHLALMCGSAVGIIIALERIDPNVATVLEQLAYTAAQPDGEQS